MHITKFWAVVSIASLGLPWVSLSAKVSLPAIFGDHMVLQSESPVPVWGHADVGERVRVAIGENTAEAIADSAGRWRVDLTAMPASDQPVELRVAGNNEIVFGDVLIGEVWLCSGQSNMAMGVGAMADPAPLVAKANRPTMRFFSVDRQVAFSPAEDCSGEWVVCTPETVLSVGGWKGFSSVGFQFGIELQDRLNRPVGLVGSNVGGTNIHTWSSLDSLKSQPRAMRTTFAATRQIEEATDDLTAAMKAYDEVLLPAWEKEREERQRPFDQWRKDADRAREQGKEIPPRPQLAKLSPHPLAPDRNYTLPTVLYNGMIAPLAPYGLRGVIWYQGEADAYPNKAEEYGTLFTSLITDWRALWGQADLPFIFVQLPNLERSKQTWPILREAQRGALKLAATAMAVSIDAGDPDDLHPANKTVIAHRLTLAARHLAYGEEMVYSGPLFSSVTVDEARLQISFTHVGQGLMIGGSPSPWYQPLTNVPAGQLEGFEVAGEDGEYHAAHAVIVGEQVQVWSDRAVMPQSVRYAWAPDPKPFANLYNRDGLPASPFQADVSP